MAIVDRHGLPLSVSTHAANHHEVRLVQLCFDFYMIEAKPETLILATAPMIVIHSMMTYAKTASRWSRRTAPIAASARRKMDADFGDMPGAGWSNGSSPGFNGSAASLSAGSFIRRTSLASCNSLASSSSSNDFEIGSSNRGQAAAPDRNGEGADAHLSIVPRPDANNNRRLWRGVCAPQ